MNQHRTAVAQYDEDFYAWTQQQAELLRQIQHAGVDLPDAVDLEHLAEEVEDLGRSELRGTTSLIRNIMVHLIKAGSDPDADAVRQWSVEADAFHDQLPDFYTPSMRRLVQIDDLWLRSHKIAARELGKYGRMVSTTVPKQCPFQLEDFLSEDFSFDEALARLNTPGKL